MLVQQTAHQGMVQSRDAQTNLICMLRRLIRTITPAVEAAGKPGVVAPPPDVQCCMPSILTAVSRNSLPLVALFVFATVLRAETVAGRVVDAATGKGVPGAAVHLLQDDKRLYSATTENDGHFQMEGVKTGVYVVNYRAAGYWPNPNLLDRADRFHVTVGAEPVQLEGKLQPVGRITGRVTDAARKPVPDAIVRAQWESWQCVAPQCVGYSHDVRTDEQGEYQLTDLELPGAWLVSATAPRSWPQPDSSPDRKTGWVETFYPGVTDQAMAGRVILSPGRELVLDVQLSNAPVHQVRGVVWNARGERMPNIALTLGNDVPGHRMSLGSTNQDGSFEFGPLPDGQWRISTKVGRDSVAPRAARWVTIKGEDLVDVQLRPEESFPVRGKIILQVPDGAKPPALPLLMMAMNARRGDPPGESFFAELHPDANGDFSMDHVFPGAYQPLALIQVPFYLDSIRLGDNEALTHDAVIASPEQQLTITYKWNVGTIRGTVKDCNAGRVILIPQEVALRRREFIRVGTCNQGDQFELPALRPGDYYAIAISGDSAMPWYALKIDESLFKQGNTVTVQEGQTANVEFRLVTP